MNKLNEKEQKTGVRRAAAKPVSEQEIEPKPAAKRTKRALILIAIDSSLTRAERDTVARAAEHTRKVFPNCSLELSGDGNDEASEEIRKSMDACLTDTLKENGRYEAGLILRRMEALTQSSKTAAILLFTGRDLCLGSQGASWCFGAGNRSRHTAVCSLYRYRKLSEAERLRCVTRTLRHEIGHALGMAADPKRVNMEKHFGLHCTAPGCSMRQTANLSTLLLFSQEEEQAGNWFCPNCLAELEQTLAKTGNNTND